MTRVEAELELLRTRFPDVQFRDPWVLVPTYPVPDVGWGLKVAKVAFRFLPGYPGTKPYAFWVQPMLKIRTATPPNATESTEPPFGGTWTQFSWDCPEWTPGPDVSSGTNMLHWALSFTERLREYS